MRTDAATLADITSASWSLMLDASTGGGTGSGIGRVVQGYDDIAQCVGIILATVPGEDPFRPTFGCDLTQYIDKPLQAAMPAIVGAVTQAIERWEPRVSVLGVVAQPGGAAAVGSLGVTVRWQIDAGAVVAPPNARLGSLGGSPAQSTTVTIGGAP